MWRGKDELGVGDVQHTLPMREACRGSKEVVGSIDLEFREQLH